MGTGIKTKDKVKVLITGLMVMYLLVSGEMIKETDMELNSL